jgi:acetyl-CoA/propionyl-CoA carboxylase biotin carboxyl carrier protein
MLYQDGDFFFLEMNTRLQVEHCVTEEVSGFDLVAEQLRVAAGEPLSFTQDDVQLRGHSIEARINAEDPTRNFLPSPGTLQRLRLPAGPGVRWDGGYHEGDTISQFYDNLIGKLVVWAPDRDRAIARLIRALREFEIGGVHTTIPAHIALLSHPDFRAVRHSTKWVEEEVDHASFATEAPAAAPAAAASANGESGDAAPLVERTLPVEVDGKRFTVRVWMPEIAVAAAPAGRRGGGAATAPGRPRPAAASGGGGAGGAGDGTVTAPMQGTIVKVLVELGTSVEIGQPILVLEAMKMENNINAEQTGTVKELKVAPGDAVGTGDVLAVIG